jgi:hypothetical protein
MPHPISDLTTMRHEILSSLPDKERKSRAKQWERGLAGSDDYSRAFIGRVRRGKGLTGEEKELVGSSPIFSEAVKGGMPKKTYPGSRFSTHPVGAGLLGGALGAAGGHLLTRNADISPTSRAVAIGAPALALGLMSGIGSRKLRKTHAGQRKERLPRDESAAYDELSSGPTPTASRYIPIRRGRQSGYVSPTVAEYLRIHGAFGKAASLKSAIRTQAFIESFEKWAFVGALARM